MNRIASRTRIVLVFILVLSLGLGFFVGEFLTQSGDWISRPGSPHVYEAGQLNIGVVLDADGKILMDTREGKAYSKDTSLNKAMIHWLGDRQGNIYAPALGNYVKEMLGYDPISGIYSYSEADSVARLTISAQVQKTAQEALSGYNGTVAVYNYRTGEILCAITTPNYDPDNVPENIRDATVYDAPFWNRFTQAAYIPGSIYKTVTMAAAMEACPELLEQTYTCTGRYDIEGDYLACEAAHGTQTAKEAFRNSCNCAFAQIAQQLGGETLSRYVKKFGIHTAVEFDGITTAKGNYDAGDADIYLARSAIGQHLDQVNPCVFLTYMGAIARGGEGVTPHLVKNISLGDETAYKAQPQVRERIMSRQTAQLLTEYMRATVAEKYGDWNFPGLNVCAKTGTAEVVTTQDGQEAAVKPNAMFAGFCQDDKYPLAFIICVEDAGYGSAVCIPIASRVLGVCKSYLDG